ncbi:MAG: RNA-binding protein [Candidatus Omnitrophota bacterium]
MNIFVGNVAYASTEDGLRKEFEAFGVVSKVTILKDRITGIPRGFGFVEMASQQEAEAAIGAINGKDFLGMVLNVSEARAKSETPQGMGKNRTGNWGNNSEHEIRKRY